MSARHLTSFGALIATAYLCVATSPMPERVWPAAQIKIPFSLGQTEAWVSVHLTGTDLVFEGDGTQPFTATLSTASNPLPQCPVPNFSSRQGFCFTNDSGEDVEFLVKVELLASPAADADFELTAYVMGEVEPTGNALVGEIEQYAYGVTLELL